MSIGLSNDYVEKLCKTLVNNHKFYGVFPCDYHPSVKAKTFSVIFNTGDSSTPGEHFVGIYCNNKYCFYFDSFGRYPDDENIKTFINNNIGSRRLIVNYQQVQHEDSNFCGFFCVGFVLSKDKRVKSYLNMFNNKHLMSNNNIVIIFILKLIKRYL